MNVTSGTGVWRVLPAVPGGSKRISLAWLRQVANVEYGTSRSLSHIHGFCETAQKSSEMSLLERENYLRFNAPKISKIGPVVFEIS